MEFNTKHLLPSTGYYNQLMREIDDADWLGEYDTADQLRKEAEHVKREHIDKGDVWYPLF